VLYATVVTGVTPLLVTGRAECGRAA